MWRVLVRSVVLAALVQAHQVPADRAPAAGGLTRARGILWEGAAVVLRSIRTRADSGLEAKAQLLVVPAERVEAAPVAALA